MLQPPRSSNRIPIAAALPVAAVLLLTLALVVPPSAAQSGERVVSGEIVGVRGDVLLLRTGEGQMRLTLTEGVNRRRLRTGSEVRVWFVAGEEDQLLATRVLIHRGAARPIVDPGSLRLLDTAGAGGIPLSGTLNARGELVGAVVSGEIVSISSGGEMVLRTGSGQVTFRTDASTQMPPNAQVGSTVSVWFEPGVAEGLVAKRVVPVPSTPEEALSEGSEDETPEETAEDSSADSIQLEVHESGPRRLRGTVIATSAERLVVRRGEEDFTFLLPADTAPEEVPAVGAEVTVWYDPGARGPDIPASRMAVGETGAES